MDSIPQIKMELFGPLNMYLALGFEIIMAIFLGGLIVFDRDQKLKSAGIKTHILICIGATLYTAVSLLNTNGTVMDPNRVPAQVVSGIGFLGAGAIIRGKGGIYGLTTAATIWIVAAVGVAIGSGFPLSAALFTLTVLGVLNMLSPLYRKIQTENDFYLRVKGTNTLETVIENYVDNLVDDVHNLDIITDEEAGTVEFHYYLQCKPKSIKSLSHQLRNLNSVKDLSFKRLYNYNSDDE
jgi:putative Mg2+ transporter-C (MgtC) family protein